MDKRIENLEVLSMEQENTIEILNREVLRQQLQIQALEQQLELLKTQIASINKEDQVTEYVEDEAPPPHY
ncbi:MAG: SlyX family protein [Cocleimonas sp.]